MKNKRIDDISKIYQNVMVFLPKTMVSIFSNAGKTGNGLEVEFDKF